MDLPTQKVRADSGIEVLENGRVGQGRVLNLFVSKGTTRALKTCEDRDLFRRREESSKGGVRIIQGEAKDGDDGPRGRETDLFVRVFVLASVAEELVLVLLHRDDKRGLSDSELTEKRP